MNGLPVWDRPVTYAHLLTPKALKMAQGRCVINITDTDWDSFFDYCERVELADKITAGVFTHFNLT